MPSRFSWAYAVLVALEQQLVGCFPASHLVHPAGAHEHHVVAVAIVVLAQTAVLVNEIVEVGIFLSAVVALLIKGTRFVNHAPQHILGVGAEVGTVAVKAGQQVPGKMRNGHDTAVLGRIGRRRMAVLFGGNPRIPRAAVKQRVPGIVAGMVGLGPFLPAGGHRTLHHGIGFLDEVDQVGIQIIAAGGFRIEAELFVELLKHIGDNGLLVLHRKHPDAEVLGLVLVPELLAGQAQQRERNLIAILGMVLLGQGHRLVVEEAGVGHLDRGFDAVLMGNGLLGLEDIQAFGQQRLAADIFLFAVTRHLLRIFRHHLRPVDHVQDKAFFHKLFPFRNFCPAGRISAIAGHRYRPSRVVPNR